MPSPSPVHARLTASSVQFSRSDTAAAAAAAAKLLQLCSTLCNPIDGSPLHSPVPGILQARKNTEVGVQSASRVQLFVTPWTVECQASLSITNSQSLLKLMSIESVMPIQPSYPLSSPSPPAFNLSQDQGLFKWVCSSHQVAEVLEFQLQHQFLQWIFRIDFL